MSTSENKPAETMYHPDNAPFKDWVIEAIKLDYPETKWYWITRVVVRNNVTGVSTKRGITRQEQKSAREWQRNVLHEYVEEDPDILKQFPILGDGVEASPTPSKNCKILYEWSLKHVCAINAERLALEEQKQAANSSEAQGSNTNTSQRT